MQYGATKLPCKHNQKYYQDCYELLILYFQFGKGGMVPWRGLASLVAPQSFLANIMKNIIKTAMKSRSQAPLLWNANIEAVYVERAWYFFSREKGGRKTFIARGCAQDSEQDKERR